jgi:hypothetical protein
MSWGNGLTEPAKLADRVIAPGDGFAEPGVTGVKRVRACEAGDRRLGTKIRSVRMTLASHLPSAIYRTLRGWRFFGSVPPGSAEPSPGALLCPPLRGSVNLSSKQSFWLRPKPLCLLVVIYRDKYHYRDAEDTDDTSRKAGFVFFGSLRNAE